VPELKRLIMLRTEPRALINNNHTTVRSLYDRHAGMLLGYIFEIVKDRKLAEEYLVEIFCDISQHFNELNWDGVNNWCQLQRFTRRKLSQLTHAELFGERIGITNGLNNRYAEHFTAEQHLVFHDVYYYGKSIEVISRELNKPEDSIRKTLKEAFAIMRRSCEN